jgi:hypothetical protein
MGDCSSRPCPHDCADKTTKTTAARLRFNIDLFIQLFQVLVDYIVLRYLRRFSIARVINTAEKTAKGVRSSDRLKYIKVKI